MAEILQATGREDWYLQQLLPAWKNLRYSKDRIQRNNLLGNLMKRGNDEARQELDRIWREQMVKGNDGPVTNFLELGTPNDYRSVLQFLESAWGKRRKVHPDGWYIHSCAERGIGEKRAAKVRKPFLARNPKFAKIADFPEVQKEREYNPISEFDTVEEAILSGQRPDFNLLNAEGLAKVVELLKGDLEFKALLIAIQVFHRFPFPDNVQILLRFLDHEKERIGYAVLNALEHIKSPLIRKTIMTRTFNTGLRTGVITALTSNFEPGDEKWIRTQIESFKDSWDVHTARMGMLRVLRKNPKADWIDLLQEAYEFSACQICRCDFAEELHKRRALPRLELEALQFDASESTRSWATKELRKLDRKATKSNM